MEGERESEEKVGEKNKEERQEKEIKRKKIRNNNTEKGKAREIRDEGDEEK